LISKRLASDTHWVSASLKAIFSTVSLKEFAIPLGNLLLFLKMIFGVLLVRQFAFGPSADGGLIGWTKRRLGPFETFRAWSHTRFYLGWQLGAKNLQGARRRQA
jgi:hypothetical protein